MALDVQGSGELLFLIPGSEVSPAFRRRAVDAVLRVEGGDESLIDRIQRNRKFHDYLREHDPEHSLAGTWKVARLFQVDAQQVIVPLFAPRSRLSAVRLWSPGSRAAQRSAAKPPRSKSSFRSPPRT